MSREHLLRQQDIIPQELLDEKITIIGAGAIGSFTALNLAKMGFESIKVYDFDTVSVENMNCQFYRFKDIGKKKCLALRDLIKDFTNVEIEAIDARYSEGIFPGIVIAAVDSMSARKKIWDNHKDKAYQTKLYVDPRMGAESALLYAMNPMDPDDIESYEKTLYTDEEAEQERCTAKSTIYTSNLLSGMVVKTIKDSLLKNERQPRVVHWSIKDNSFMSWQKKVAASF